MRKTVDEKAWDSDSDYVADYWEIYNYYTDPTKSDSDDDGAPEQSHETRGPHHFNSFLTLSQDFLQSFQGILTF